MNITQDYITLHIYRYHRQITTESYKVKYKVKGTDRKLALSDG